MFALSLSYRTENADERSRFSFDDQTRKDFLKSLKSSGIKEAVYLFTCSRCEIYGEGDFSLVPPALSSFSGVPLEEIKTKMLCYEGNKAIRRLFSVTCGMDSPLKGEDEILRQVKEAFEFSRNEGFTEKNFNTIFKAAVTCAKKSKTETYKGKTSVSLGTLAASVCKEFSEGNNMRVLILGGSGEIGGKVIKNLLSFGSFNIFATVRKHMISNKNITLAPYDKRFILMDEMDIIVSATKSPHLTVTFESVKNLSPKKRLFIDLAVPRDIDPDVAKLPFVKLLDMDDFKDMALKNSIAKSQNLNLTEIIIDKSVDELIKELAFRDALPLFTDLDEKTKQFVYNYREAADSNEFESFLKVLNKMRGLK